MSGHTPGPWRRDGSQVAPPPVGGGQEHTVYLVGGKGGKHPTIFVSSTVRTKAETAQFEANVALILAAPDLLAACAAVRASGGLTGANLANAVAMCRAAEAKAISKAEAGK